MHIFVCQEVQHPELTLIITETVLLNLNSLQGHLTFFSLLYKIVIFDGEFLFSVDFIKAGLHNIISDIYGYAPLNNRISMCNCIYN